MSFPPQLIAVVAAVLADRYTHNQLDLLFLEAGAPGEKPEGAKPAKCEAWLRRIRDEMGDAAPAVLGLLLQEILEEDALTDEAARRLAMWSPASVDPRKARDEGRKRVLAALTKAGFTYLGNGQLARGGVAVASRQLSDLIKTRDLPALEAEFATLAVRAAGHPRDALSAAANIVEGVMGEMIAGMGLSPPANRTVNTLWTILKPAINADPAAMPDGDLKKIAGAMAAMVDGLQGLRDDKSRAHAMRPELARSYRIEPRHARLAVNASLALTVFLLEAWQAIEDRRSAGRA
ncbi:MULTISPECIES: abortive infection family protein [Roseomonadaceae]|uniref:Abortive infection family protein n=1 Tax=Falsiroseomonas oleicola TaxID=2801474 RepID=A0ABS6HBH8_9PROT|nr:abortive infection family protein [Roseomonas oleicola]MBU8546064.1 abortive infection family protein [Roseomonas oleicola]